MAVFFNVEVAADQTTGDEDYTFDVEVASDAAMTTARKLIGRRVFQSGTPTAPFTDADLLVAGDMIEIPLPQLGSAEIGGAWMLKFLFAFMCVLVVPIESFADHQVGHNGVITVQEWNGPGLPTGEGWSFNVGLEIDCAMPPSPSGGCAVRATYSGASPTPTTSKGFGRTDYVFPDEDDVYIGSWQRYSENFIPHPNGWKAEFFNLGGSNSGCRNIAMGWSGSTMIAATQVCWDTGTSPTYYPNTGSWDFLGTRGQWVWVEKRVKVNTPGVCDGSMQQWMNDVLYMSHLDNVCFRAPGETRGIGSMLHTSEYGGGGFAELPAPQQWWIDHTVISTQRIGMPGGKAPPTDTTPPTAPTNLVAQ